MKNLPLLNKRVKQVIDNETDGNVSKFASLLDTSQQKVNRLFIIDTRTNKFPTVPSDVLVKISELFVDINPEWLLTGKGEMYKGKLTPKLDSILKTHDQEIEQLKEAVRELKNRLDSIE